MHCYIFKHIFGVIVKIWVSIPKKLKKIIPWDENNKVPNKKYNTIVYSYI